MNEELKLCPFCGAQSGCPGANGPVRCGSWNCAARGPEFTDRATAINAWNRRIDPLRAELASLRAERVTLETVVEAAGLLNSCYRDDGMQISLTSDLNAAWNRLSDALAALPDPKEK